MVGSSQAHFSTGLNCGSFSACAQFSIASSRFNLVGINWNLGPTGFCSLNKILACVLCCACFLVFLFDCACLHLWEHSFLKNSKYVGCYTYGGLAGWLYCFLIVNGSEHTQKGGATAIYLALYIETYTDNQYFLWSEIVVFFRTKKISLVNGYIRMLHDYSFAWWEMPKDLQW